MSIASTAVELTLAEFASQWPYALRLFRRARDAVLNGAMPERVRLGIEMRAETEAAQLLKSWDEERHRQILGLRELDLPRESHDLALRANAVERVRFDINGKIRARYRALAEKIGRFFAMQLAERYRQGATVRARHPNGTLETLTRSDILGGVLDVGNNMLFSKDQKWVSVSVSLPSGAQVSEGPLNEPALSKSSTSDNEMLEWMLHHQCSLKKAGKLHGREIILAAAMKQFEAQYKSVRSIWEGRRR